MPASRILCPHGVAAGDGFCHLHPKTGLRGSTEAAVCPRAQQPGPGRPARARARSLSGLSAPTGLHGAPFTHPLTLPLQATAHSVALGKSLVLSGRRRLPRGKRCLAPRTWPPRASGRSGRRKHGVGAANGSCKVGSSWVSPEGSGILLSPTHRRQAPGPGLPSSPFLFSGPPVILPHCRALLGWGACWPARGLPSAPVTDDRTGAARASPTPAGVSGLPGAPLAGSSHHIPTTACPPASASPPRLPSGGAAQPAPHLYTAVPSPQPSSGPGSRGPGWSRGRRICPRPQAPMGTGCVHLAGNTEAQEAVTAA